MILESMNRPDPDVKFVINSKAQRISQKSVPNLCYKSTVISSKNRRLKVGEELKLLDWPSESPMRLTFLIPHPSLEVSCRGNCSRRRI